MKKFSTLLTIAILIAGGIYFFVLSKTSVLYNFECIAPLYSDTSILKVCLMPVPPKRNSFVRYVYVYNGVVYNIKKNALGEVMVYGNPLNDEVQKRVVINFKQDLDFLHLKGISGSCLSIEKEIKFKIEFFFKYYFKIYTSYYFFLYKCLYLLFSKFVTNRKIIFIQNQ